MNDFDFERFLSMAVLHLNLSPTEFWNSTFRELGTLIAYHHSINNPRVAKSHQKKRTNFFSPADRADINARMNKYSKKQMVEVDG